MFLSAYPGFSEAEKLLAENMHSFAQDVIAPLAETIDKENTFPEELWIKLGQMGCLGITAPEQYGGANMGYLAHCICMSEISEASASVGLSYAAHSNLCLNQIVRYGTDNQKTKYLPNLISGKAVGALAISETNAGSDAMSIKTRAEQNDEGFIINGQKMWITNGPDADIIVIYANTGFENNKPKLTAFILDKSLSNWKVSQKLDKLGMRGSNTCELIFENCFVPKENVLGELNGGASVMMSGLDIERLVLAAGPLGILKACLNLSCSYANTRHQFGKAISAFQLIQAKIADIYTSFQAAQRMVYSVAQQCDMNLIDSADCASTILFASESATQAALQTVQILGGNGYTNEYPAGRYLRDAKLYEIGAGTSEIRRQIIARSLQKK